MDTHTEQYTQKDKGSDAMSVLKEKNMGFCPACGHNTISHILAQVIDEMKIQDNIILLTSPGCSIIVQEYFDCDIVECAHGRAPAVATGLKRALPDKIIVCYQGDGDLASIGISEIIHTANRNENISVIFANNAIFSMTGGQAAPTTIPGQETTTTPKGSTAMPMKVCELLSALDSAEYLERCSVDTPINISITKKAIIKMFQNQIDSKGFSLVEILSPCPTGWKTSPKESLRFIEKMKIHFPLKKIKG